MPLNIQRPPKGLPPELQNWANSLVGELERFGRETATSWVTTDPTNASNITSGILALARGGSGANLGSTGGANQFFRQNSVGAAVDVVQPATSALSTVSAAPSAGQLGQKIESNIPLASAVNLANNVSKDVTSIALTAGVWLVWGNIAIVPTNNTGGQLAWLGDASATPPTAPNGGGETNLQAALTGALTSILWAGVRNIVNAGPGSQTVYLSTNVNFPAGTCTAYGYIGAVRIA